MEVTGIFNCPCLKGRGTSEFQDGMRKWQKTLYKTVKDETIKIGISCRGHQERSDLEYNTKRGILVLTGEKVQRLKA